uniref:Uncharacterized protein n=1 Tax=Oryza sativa subsp. japonica TaxID=39947 RepID=Q94LB8_ORYSJ|nr:hypothetical protein [Oryza sativa Japonica Group]
MTSGERGCRNRIDGAGGCAAVGVRGMERGGWARGGRAIWASGVIFGYSRPNGQPGPARHGTLTARPTRARPVRHGSCSGPCRAGPRAKASAQARPNELLAVPGRHGYCSGPWAVSPFPIAQLPPFPIAQKQRARAARWHWGDGGGGAARSTLPRSSGGVGNAGKGRPDPPLHGRGRSSPLAASASLIFGSGLSANPPPLPFPLLSDRGRSSEDEQKRGGHLKRRESSGARGQRAAVAAPPLSPSVASLLSSAAPLSPLPSAVACRAGGGGGIGEERRTAAVPATSPMTASLLSPSFPRFLFRPHPPTHPDKSDEVPMANFGSPNFTWLGHVKWRPLVLVVSTCHIG